MPEAEWKELPTALPEASLKGRRVGAYDWEVDAVTRAGEVQFRVSVPERELAETPVGAAPLTWSWTEQDIENGVAHAVEMALVSPGADAPKGVVRELTLKAYHLYAAKGRL